MAKFMLDGQEYCGGSGSQIIELTQAEYDALPDTKNTDNILYAITDCDELSAENMSFDDTETQLGVNNVQDAIVEQNKNFIFKKVYITTQINDLANGATDYFINMPYTPPAGYVIVIAECYASSGCEASYGGYDSTFNKFIAMVSNNSSVARSPYITIGCLLVKEEFYEYTTVRV